MRVLFDAALVPLLQSVGRAAGDSGARAWVVGGVVRDALLGRANNDVDIALDGDVPRLVEALGREWQADPQQHDAFTTATLRRRDGAHVDIVRTRSETYTRPGALPTITPDGIEADLRRRDFSVNAMAASIMPQTFGELLDPMGGAADLSNGVLRALHPASFTEDPTRLFRAARHAVRYDLRPDAMTDATARAAAQASALETVSADRRRREVEITCHESRWSEMADWLNRWGVWEALSNWRPQPSFLRHADVVLAWARRHRVEPSPEAARFRFLSILAQSNDALRSALSARPAESQRVARARRILETLGSPDTADWRRAMDTETTEALLLALSLVGRDGQKRRLTDYLTDVRPVRSSVTGADLLAAGARPGPAVGAALRETLDAVRDGRVSGWEAELAFALSVYHEGETRFSVRNIC